MPKVLMYTQTVCFYCDRAKGLLRTKGVDFEEINTDQVVGSREEMVERSQRRTVPQIWIDDVHVGGSDELFALEQGGKLDQMLGLNQK